MAGLGSWELPGALKGGGPKGSVDAVVNIPLHPKLQPGRGHPCALSHMNLGKRESHEAQETHWVGAPWERYVRRCMALGIDSCVGRRDWGLAETRVEAVQGAGGDTQKHRQW